MLMPLHYMQDVESCKSGVRCDSSCYGDARRRSRLQLRTARQSVAVVVVVHDSRDARTTPSCVCVHQWSEQTLTICTKVQQTYIDRGNSDLPLARSLQMCSDFVGLKFAISVRLSVGEVELWNFRPTAGRSFDVANVFTLLRFGVCIRKIGVGRL
jgi:hypothetical protein